MPRSMTAFARHTVDFTWGSVSCELRSVNHRFLETGFRLPETLRDVEMQLREIARKKLTRGEFHIGADSRVAIIKGDLQRDIDLATG